MSIYQHNNLQPSNFSADGFLGNDSRSFEEIVEADRTALRDLGINKKNIVKRLNELFEKGKSAFGNEVEIGPGITVTYFESRGQIPSPFPEDGLFDKGEVVVKNKKTGEQLIISALSIALIEKHDFFQGKGSRYRIEPKAVKSIL